LGHRLLRRETIRFNRATGEIEAWVFPARNSAVMQRIVHMLTVIAVVVRAFLLSVSGICGRVEVK
jgi:hypothetical protein